MARKISSPWLRTINGQSHKVWHYSDTEGKARSLGCKEHDEEKAYAKWKEIVAREGNPSAEVVLTIADLVAAFIAVLTGTVSSEYIRQLRSVLSQFAESFRSTPLREIQPHQIETWIDGHATWGSTTKANQKRRLSTFFHWLEKKQYIDRVPTKQVKAYTARSRGEEVLISPDDWTKFITMTKGNFRLICETMWETGARPKELRLLQIDEVDLVKAEVVKAEHKGKHKGKRRTILLTAKAVEHIRAAIGNRTTGPVFLSREGRAWTASAFSGKWRTARTRAGLTDSFVPYGTRHTFGTTKLEAGAPDHAVASLMGHSNTKMLYAHYGHVLDKVRSYRRYL